MSETMKAAVLHAVGDMRIEDVPKPEVTSPDDVLIRITSVGICGSDIHFLKHGRIGNIILDKPTIMGHESAGEVVGIGSAVTRVEPGDLVAIEPGKTCRRCEFCKSGHYNLCREVVFLAAPPADGAFCEYLVWPEDFVFKMPEGMTADEGAMMEPLSVGLHAVRSAGVRGGDSVAVLGAGPIGLTTLMSAKAHGATTIIVTDVFDTRLANAKRMGATHVINVRETDPVAAIKDLTGSRGVDASFDCVGSELTLQQALQVARNQGAMQCVGNPQELLPRLPIFEIINRELTVRGTFRYVNCYPPAITLTAAGAVDVRSMVTHHFPLAETVKAMEWVDQNKDKVIKAVIHP